MFPEMIAITGPTSTGKTTLRTSLEQHLSPVATLHTYDAYDLAATPEALQHFLTTKGAPPNWENPFVFDNEAYVRDVQALARGETVTLYDRSREAMRHIVLEPKSYVIIEGILSWWDSRVVELFSKRIYLDLDETEIVRRRLVRPRNPNLWSHTPEYIQGPLLVGTRTYIHPQRLTATHIVNADQPPERILKDVLTIIQPPQ